MRIFNVEKTMELTEYDPERGELRPDELVIHHDAVDHVEEVGHYEVLREYPNGGKDVEWVVDVEGIEGHDAYDEVEDILVYVPYTENQLLKMSLQREREECLEWLRAHDYIGIKIATGRATINDYANEISEMRLMADRINEIEQELLLLETS